RRGRSAQAPSGCGRGSEKNDETGGRQAIGGAETRREDEIVVGHWSLVIGHSSRPTTNDQRPKTKSEGRYSGPEGSPVWVPARIQQDVAVALVLGPRLREAGGRGSGAATEPGEARRASRSRGDRGRTR